MEVKLIMKTILEKVKQSRQLVSLYEPNDQDQFNMGYVLELKENEMIVFNINSEDRINSGSYLWTEVDRICRIHAEGQDEKRSIERMKRYQGEKLSRKIDDFHLEAGDGESLQMAFLKYAKKNDKFVECAVNDDTRVGIVIDITDSLLVLKEIDYYGKEDGISYILLSGIWKIYIDGEKSREAEYLYHYQK